MSTFFTLIIAFISLLVSSFAQAQPHLDAGTILRKMASNYIGVNDYHTQVMVKEFKSGGVVKTQKFLYTFKKPNRIHIDFESPRAGWTLVYPDENGKVALRSPGDKHFFTLHLSTSSRFLRAGSGQRIDQTDMGLLIENISHSVTDKRKGPVQIVQVGGIIQISVLAEDHFNDNIETLYRFSIDARTWLPVEVEESTPDGKPKRTVEFRDTMTNIGTPDAFFEMKETPQ